MQTLKIYPTSINARHIDIAVQAMLDGKIIAYPTDTLYALGCNSLSQRAIERLCTVKGINPEKNLLSVVCADLSMAAQYAKIDNRSFQIIKRNAPGPFTFVLPAANTLPKAFKGRHTVGIRIPDNAIARELARALGNPILSASITAEDDTIVIAEQIELLPGLAADILIDGGEVDGRPSTIVDLTDSTAPTILRQGGHELR